MSSDDSTDPDPESVPEASVGTTLERRFGYYFSLDSDRVWNDKSSPAGPIILNKDGTLNTMIRDAIEKRSSAQSTLWRRLGPLDIEGATIKKNTRLYHRELKQHLQAVEIDVGEDAEPSVRFKIVDSWPLRHITFRGSMIEDLRRSDQLLTQEELAEDTIGLLSQSESADSQEEVVDCG